MSKNPTQEQTAHDADTPDYGFLSTPEALEALGGGEETYQAYIGGKLDEQAAEAFARQGPAGYERFMRQRNSAIGGTAVRNTKNTESTPRATSGETVTGKPVAETVFKGVYDALTYDLKHKPTRKGFRNGQEVTVTINPSLEFATPYFERAHDTVVPLAKQAPDFRGAFNQDATEEAHKVKAYQGRPDLIAQRLENARHLTADFLNRAEQMKRRGETDDLTINLFLDRIEYAKSLARGYNQVTKKTDETMPPEAANERYAHALPILLSGNPDRAQQATAPFVHMNVKKHQGSSYDTVERYYISPKLNGQPERVVQIWTETLQDMGLDKELYYKVSEGIALRYDLLIAYTSSKPGDKEKMKNVIQEFTRRCPPELLSETTLPTGAEIVPGVARTPEPTELNRLLRYRGKSTVSYNEFACALTDLAFRRASYDFIKQGRHPQDVTPKELAAAAKPYFSQMVALSGIDPVTMESFPS